MEESCLLKDDTVYFEKYRIDVFAPLHHSWPRNGASCVSSTSFDLKSDEKKHFLGQNI